MPHRSKGHALLLVPLLAAPSMAQGTVPTDIQQPGTQPREVSALESAGRCDNCHAGYDPAVEPATLWRGSLMAHASRDPLFWATLAVAESDFPGAGDLCLRCHTPAGWIAGRSVPTDGSGLAAGDADGVECDVCHRLTNPDGSEHPGVQNPPFLAHNEGSPPAGYYGSGMGVFWPGSEKLGPYCETVARHGFLQSRFHRSPDFCGTCHDVSNPLVGDVAHNNGAPVPLPPGTFSGRLGGPVDGKAAFNNFPHQYGIVERTSSEFRAGELDTTRVSAYPGLPAWLQAGAIRRAYERSLLAGTGGDYEDGTARTFTCQTCHVAPGVGKGCNKNDAPLRRDLPLHHMAGGNTWVPDAILHLDQRGLLRLGGGLNAGQVAALVAGKARAREELRQAAALSVSGNVARIVNLTGHKLITGYPEGRRMWLRARWRDPQGRLLRQDGGYGPITVRINGNPAEVETLLDPSDPRARVYEAKPGITRAWAGQLIAAGLPPALPLVYDRVSGAVVLTLGELAALPPGTSRETFHFVLNNTVLKDNRIPPYGMEHDEALRRNALPVPPDQYGNPGPGGVYRCWDDVPLEPPPGATAATLDLLYQTTSWEYVQFLYLANDRRNPFLADTGANLLLAWRETGMAAPEVMATASWTGCGPAACEGYGTGWPGTHGVPVLSCSAPPVLGSEIAIQIPNSSGLATTVFLLVGLTATSVPTPLGGTILATPDFLLVTALPTSGLPLPLTVPADPGLCGATFHAQAVQIDPGASAGFSFTPGLRVIFGS